MLKAIHVTKKFGELVAVNDLSFDVEKGQIFGIAGPNGAGKSTVYNLITGFFPFDGAIEFEGRNISGMPTHRIAQLGISRTFQIPRTFPSLTVEKSVGVGSRFGDPGGFDRNYVDRIIDFMGLEAVRRETTGQLNLLGKKKLMIGAALATRPKLLMLDEPMAGSNTSEIKSLMHLIQAINTDLGVTIIIIEHFMKVLTELTGTLLIIQTGTKLCCGDPREVTSDPRVIESYLGEAYADGIPS
ncbi:ABC transporter ATP-binding protein [Desulfococcus sp.]|uniref:ABC transporter ATP-binding protein n=1 Tax=Desulfococcus sp. TaxID=2025834 RepID=UPI003593244E